ncbi:orotidine-5'-phosphate decarboxylase [Clostridium sp.]|jgi:orotidine-5'-phosphate decarboxylase|uniref:orotidine-5'-phosphate decarboxylase n=1 Tax=Clostridium sp. TaxID=1506 RepID=UPI002590A862|nr:orotidine-5'-phosphate decarboxylase [Clostridium sp.]MDF2503425.1 orotidine 5-phosphate decarboxylase, subfamily 2 [Clostridium sp.]
MIIDELYQKVAKNGHVCLGLDTDIDYIPSYFLNKYNNIEDAIFNFNKKIIDETLDAVACYKVQIAYYEAYGIKGLNAYKKTLEYIKSQKAISIADIKRGDIAKTAEMYAKAHFEGDFESDFVTLNPYMGFDSVEPYTPYIRDKEKGVFILLRTSNPGSKDIQYISTADNDRVYNVVGKKINDMGKEYLGECEYSSIGAVVGCTTGFEGKEIRDKYKSTFFLIPGYGAQGGTAEEVANYLSNGNGGIVNSSRGILLAYKKVEDGEHKFEQCARNAAIIMRDDIRSYSKNK